MTDRLGYPRSSGVDKSGQYDDINSLDRVILLGSLLNSVDIQYAWLQGQEKVTIAATVICGDGHRELRGVVRYALRL